MSKKIDPRSSGQLPIPDAHRLGCTSYSAGHNVHWIQALHTANKSEVSVQSWRGQLVTVDGEVLTVRKPGGDLTRFRNHDPARLVAVVERTGAAVLINDEYAILRVGSLCFSVTADSGARTLGRRLGSSTSAVANTPGRRVASGFGATASATIDRVSFATIGAMKRTRAWKTRSGKLSM